MVQVKTVKFLFFLLLCISAASAFAAETADAFRYLNPGDNAFRHDDYENALRFYRKFYDETAPGTPMRERAVQSISRCLIKTNKRVEAEKYLQILERDYSDSNENRLLRAQLLIFLGRYPAAQTLLTNTISNKIIAGETYYQMLTALGYCYLQRHMRPEAAETYKLLEKAAIGSKYEFIAYRQLLYTLIVSNDFKAADAKFAEAEDFSKDPSFAQIEALKLFLDLRQNNLERFREGAGKFFAAQTPGADALFFEICENAAQVFEAKKDYIFGAQMRLEAFRFALSQASAKDNFLIRIKDLTLAGEKQQAVAGCLLFAERFQGSPEALQVKFAAADMMSELGLSEDALALYAKISSDAAHGAGVRAKAALSAAGILIKQKKYDEAAEFLNTLDDKSSKLTDAQKGERDFMRATILFAQGKYAESAEAFEKCAQQYDAWRDRGRFQFLMCLMQLKKYDQALKVADLLIADSTGPVAADASYYRALALDRSNNILQAQKAYSAFALANADHQYAPNALFRAGQIAFAHRDYPQALNCFGVLVDKYPENYYAANGCYRALLSSIALKEDKAMQKYSTLMMQKYPQSVFAADALFALLDIYRELRQFDKAYALLENLQTLFKDKKALVERLELEKARLLSDEKKVSAAIKQCAKFIKSYPTSPLYAQAMLLAGNLASQKGDYLAAAAYYLLGAERKDGSDVALVCLGRYADCNFVLYSKEMERKFLEKALKSYQKLLDNKNMPVSLRNQSLYKLGRCNELQKNDPEAMTCYLEVIYSAEPRKLSDSDKLWVVKSARRAIMLYLKHGGEKNLQKALNICNVLRELNIDTNEDIARLREQIRRIGLGSLRNRQKK